MWFVANPNHWNFHWSRFSWATLSLCTADAKLRNFFVAVESPEALTFSSNCCWWRKLVHPWTVDCCHKTAADDGDGFVVASCNVVDLWRELSESDNYFHCNCRWLECAGDERQAGGAGGMLWISLVILVAVHFQKAVGAWGAMEEVLDIFTFFLRGRGNIRIVLIIEYFIN